MVYTIGRAINHSGFTVGVRHSVGEAIAKPRLPMAFLGRTEERES